MPIYIEGVEMPTSPVLFCIHPDGKVFADLEGNWREYKAVPVPAHGRLIDADSAMKAACEALCHPGVFCPDFLCKEVREKFDAVSTIIPAEEEGHA